MQVYGRGLIRRLPPMLGGDPRRIRMVYSLLFSLPGTPVLFYGEEIGMGENLAAGDRLAVRTPMQWSADKNGGFSNAAPSGCPGSCRRAAYGPEFVNVTDQQRDPDSLLNFIRRLATTYRDCPELGWGDVRGARAAARWRCWPTAAPGTTRRSWLLHNAVAGPGDRAPDACRPRSRHGARRPAGATAWSSRTTRGGSSCRWGRTATAGCGSRLQVPARLRGPSPPACRSAVPVARPAGTPR